MHWWKLRSNYFPCASLRTRFRLHFLLQRLTQWLRSSPNWELSSSPRAPLALGTGSTLCLPCVGPQALPCSSTCRHATMNMTVISTSHGSPFPIILHYSPVQLRLNGDMSYESSLACVTSLVLKWLMEKKSYVPWTSFRSSSLKTGSLQSHRWWNKNHWDGGNVSEDAIER